MLAVKTIITSTGIIKTMNTEAKPINIALVGGGRYCEEFLDKIERDYTVAMMNSRICMVIDSDQNASGMVRARDMGIPTTSEFRDIYNHNYGIQFVIILSPDKELEDYIIYHTARGIRIITFQIFKVIWEGLNLEQNRNKARSRELETILNGIQEFIVVISPEKDILEANSAFLENMNYTREEVIGKKCFEVYQKYNRVCTPDDRFCPVNNVTLTSKPSRDIIQRLDNNNEPRYMDVSVFPIFENDKITKFIEVSRDVTDEKHQDEALKDKLEKMVAQRTRELEETHEKLLHQDKMASLGKLSASVVHEVNNPIAGILNLIMLMKRIMGEQTLTQNEIDTFLQYLNLMDTETRRVSRIISNLLAFARQSKIEFTSFHINKLLESTMFLNSNLLKLKRVKPVTKFAPDLPFYSGSEDQMQQVFMNMLSNAAEAIDGAGGGELSVETRYSISESSIHVIFKDSGIGIPPENLANLFEPFFTTKKKGKGVGLGLSVAYGIIEEHGGSIVVESDPGKGTAFTIKLPVNKKS